MIKTNEIIRCAIRDIDWRVVVSTYAEYDALRSELKASNKGELSDSNLLKSAVQSHLKSVLEFVLVNEIKSFICSGWIIYNDISTKQVLSVYFTPLHTEVSVGSSTSIPDSKVELVSLNNLLQEAVSKENYELAATIRNKISALVVTPKTKK